MPIRHSIIESVSISNEVDPDEILAARSRSMMALGSDQVEIYKNLWSIGMQSTHAHWFGTVNPL